MWTTSRFTLLHAATVGPSISMGRTRLSTYQIIWKVSMRTGKLMVFSVAAILAAACGSENADVIVGGKFASDKLVKVYKDDEKVQCEESNIDLDEMALELSAGGIDVLCSQKGNDGEPKDAACSIDEGSINVYLINAENESDAVALGFSNVNSLPRYIDTPYD